MTPGPTSRSEALDADSPGFRDRLEQAVRLHRSGNRAEAEAIYRQLLEIIPEHPDALHFLGLSLFERGAGEDAVATISRSIAAKPDFAGFHYNLGNVLHALGRPAEAADSFRRATELAPQNADAWSNLGNVLLDLRRLPEAIEALRLALDRRPDHIAALVNLGTALRDNRETGAATETFARALEIDPGLVAAHVGLGMCRTTAGDFPAAESSFRRALGIQPDCVEALYQLSMMGTPRDADAIVGRLEGLLARPETPAEQRVSCHFALGKLCDDRTDYDAAFAHYRRGNAIRFDKEPWDPSEIEELVERSKTVFTPEIFRERQDFGNSSERPVFVVGMPRSGTTLIEQILASHPQVHGAGEVSVIDHFVRTLPAILAAGTGYPDCVPAIDRQTAAELSSTYLGATDGGTQARFVVDKMPDNFRWLGLIALLFPNARVVHCQRHPMDTCLSCYFQLFQREHGYAFDLTSLGTHYRGYRSMMDHWRRVLPLRMHEMQYEDLVAEPERAVRELIAFCDLDWDVRCLHFHTHDHEIRTASQWQARQPIYARSVGRWRNYERHLAPLVAALGDAVSP